MISDIRSSVEIGVGQQNLTNTNFEPRLIQSLDNLDCPLLFSILRQSRKKVRVQLFCNDYIFLFSRDLDRLSSYQYTARSIMCGKTP